MNADAQIVIRRARDLDDALVLINEYSERFQVVRRDTSEDILHYLSSADSGVWMAHSQSEPIGCIVLRPLSQAANSAEVKRLYVRDNWRGRGVASQLLKALESWAIEFGYQSIYLDTNENFAAAVAFYRREGYKDCPRYNDNPQATIFMRKSLPGHAS